MVFSDLRLQPALKTGFDSLGILSQLVIPADSLCHSGTRHEISILGTQESLILAPKAGPRGKRTPREVTKPFGSGCLRIKRPPRFERWTSTTKEPGAECVKLLPAIAQGSLKPEGKLS